MKSMMDDLEQKASFFWTEVRIRIDLKGRISEFCRREKR